jgi:hypothetical protein
MTLTAQQLFDREFSRPRTKRSAEFKAGVLALLRRLMEGIEIACPYTEGTAAFDAFYSGIEEGWRIYHNESDIGPERIEPKQQETRP